MVKLYNNVAINYSCVVSVQIIIRDKALKIVMSNGHIHVITFEAAWKTEEAYKEAISLMSSET